MFRFTIRDVLWLMSFVAILCSWWLDRSAIARERNRMAHAIFIDVSDHIEFPTDEEALRFARTLQLP